MANKMHFFHEVQTVSSCAENRNKLRIVIVFIIHTDGTRFGIGRNRE